VSKSYASYEKKIVSKVIKIRHIIRIKPKDQAGDIIRTLSEVPANAKIVDINNYDNILELIFGEEKTIDD